MASNRTQDRLDVENMLASGKNIDVSYIKKTVDAHNIPIKMLDIFEKLR